MALLNRTSTSNLPSTGLRLPTTKRYELSNHLGNVLTTITGRRMGIGDGIIDFYQAERIQATDYYAYGLELPNRSYTNTAYSTATNSYRYGFNEDRLVSSTRRELSDKKSLDKKGTEHYFAQRGDPQKCGEHF